ncbi:hypothetical protein LOK49_LG04G01203 [Camellia lanceoleosa]|uniref:Uncharacterized protein n=1 Tax=Camellia lanceoleosa TaxID=1840588 RepID=A0ACC0HWM9_9ERIC|nr:hypothetical protein LOK49_LG04G01203 [Camellia lanceoleosa]
MPNVDGLADDDDGEPEGDDDVHMNEIHKDFKFSGKVNNIIFLEKFGACIVQLSIHLLPLPTLFSCRERDWGPTRRAFVDSSKPRVAGRGFHCCRNRHIGGWISSVAHYPRWKTI